MTKLEEKIKYHQELYYNNSSLISDEEFDALWDSLKKEEPESELLKDIGNTVWEGWPKMKHRMMMGSQDKFNNEADFRDWLRIKLIKFPVMIQYKLDGLSVELQYDNGVFKSAVTRGNGLEGDDITPNAIKMKGVPKTLADKNFTGAIRGEILLNNETFEKYFSDAKNPRNMASGITKRKSGVDSEHLTVIVYDAFFTSGVFKTEKDKFHFLQDNGFKPVTTRMYDTPEELIEYRDFIVKEREANRINVAIDGLVLKQNIIVESDLLRKRPEYQRAFKFDTEEVITKLLDIEWNRNGHNYTPVAILEPVDLMGSIIKRASLANLDNIKKLGVGIGDDVLIHKAGEIIPQILKVISHNGNSAIVHPTKCEICDTKLTITGPRIYCPNPHCGGRKLHRLEKWIAKTGAKGFGPSLMNYLFDNSFITNIEDLYTVDLEEVLGYTNLKKAASKAFANLYKVKEMKLESFVSGFDIEGIGEGVVKFAVDAKINTLNDLHNASVSDFEMVDGFSEGRAKLLYDAMQSLYEEMAELTKYVSIKEKGEPVRMGSKLNGKSFCFTGKLENITRAEAQNLVTLNGGIVKNSVTKDLDFLITNTPNSGTSKNKKALSFGTELITEESFMKRITD